MNESNQSLLQIKMISQSHLDHEPIVGVEAKEAQAFGDTEVASFFKYSIGEENYIEYFNDTIYSSQTLSAIFLTSLKDMAEEAFQSMITDQSLQF